jgi:hypothetical protein
LMKLRVHSWRLDTPDSKTNAWTPALPRESVDS